MGSVRITFTGTGSGFPEPGRFFSGYLAETQAGSLLLDVNEQSVKSLVPKFKNNPDHPFSCFISHTHPDHWPGLFLLIQFFHQIRRTKPWYLYVPPELDGKVGDLARLHHLYPERLSVFPELRQLTGEPVPALPDLDVQPVASSHMDKYRDWSGGQPCSSFGFRLVNPETGRRIALTMDAGSPEDVLRLAGDRKPELLVLDGSHLSPAEIRELATRLDPVSWMISHYDLGLKQEFPFHYLAGDGQELEVIL